MKITSCCSNFVIEKNFMFPVHCDNLNKLMRGDNGKISLQKITTFELFLNNFFCLIKQFSILINLFRCVHTQLVLKVYDRSYY